MIGIVYSTCGRPNNLFSSLQSLRRKDVKIFVIDNGSTQNAETKKVCFDFGASYIDGKEGNSPSAQNIGFSFLRDKAEFILKSDDDVDYNENYLDILESTIKKDSTIAAVSGCTYSKYRLNPIEYVEKRWKCGDNYIDDSQLLLYKINSPKLLTVNHLHGGFLYRVSSAKYLYEKTISLRHGLFGGYFSKYAFGEESEFSFLLGKINNQKLVVIPQATAYHHYAKGGIRELQNQQQLLHDDKTKMNEICNVLGYTYVSTVFKEFYEYIHDNTK